MTGPRYRVAVDGEDDGVAINGDVLIDTWGESVPDLAAKVLDLRVGMSAIVFQHPRIVVRRLS